MSFFYLGFYYYYLIYNQLSYVVNLKRITKKKRYYTWMVKVIAVVKVVEVIVLTLACLVRFEDPFLVLSKQRMSDDRVIMP